VNASVKEGSGSASTSRIRDLYVRAELCEHGLQNFRLLLLVLSGSDLILHVSHQTSNMCNGCQDSRQVGSLKLP
jgi:hypothetical protein